MRNIRLVIKYEIGKTLRTRSFWVMTFLIPLIFLATHVYYLIEDNGFGNRDTSEETASGETVDASRSTSKDTSVIGLVDEAGLIVEIPEGIPSGMFLPFPDASTARDALEANEIEQYVHIPADFIDSGKVTVYTRNFQLRSGGEEMGVAFGSSNQWALDHLINVNLTGDEKLVAMLRNPVPGALAEYHAVKPPERDQVGDQELGQLVSSVIPYAFYFVMLVGTGYLMRSVVAEKENRTVEVLLLSLHPQELMVGKIVGLSAVTLFQLAIWFGGGVLILDRGRDWLDFSNYDFPPGFAVWAILFLALGFLLYASVMAAAGAMARTAREGNQVTWLLIMPLMPTLMFSRVFFEQPHGTLSMVLSLFPLSAPSAMVTRLAVANVPIWQPILSLLALAFTAYLMVLLSARFFQADNLLSTTAFSWRRFATGWQERVQQD